jgi:hypothetical protein
VAGDLAVRNSSTTSQDKLHVGDAGVEQNTIAPGFDAIIVFRCVSSGSTTFVFSSHT